MKEVFKNGYTFSNGIEFINYIDSQYAKFKCVCGKEFISRIYDVKSNRANSCGKCPTIKIENYDDDTYKIIYIGKGKNHGVEGYIVKEWYHYLIDILGVSANWTAKNAGSAKTLYWQTILNGKYVRVHTLISYHFLDCDNVIYTIDHIDNNELNNSRINVRKADKVQQAYNTTRNKGAKRYTGVCKTDNMYYMRCNVNGKTLYFAPYENEHIAALARNFLLDTLNIVCARAKVPSKYILSQEQKETILAKL